MGSFPAFLVSSPLPLLRIRNHTHHHRPRSLCASSFIPRSRPQSRASVRPVRLTMTLPESAHGTLTVLVVGSGGREHALVQSISQSPYLSKLIALPGNVGMEPICECVPAIAVDDVPAIVSFAISRHVSLVVVGPEVPLVQGLVDRLREEDIPAFGPTADAALLEGDKIFSKCFLERHKIPTAPFAAFNDVEPAKLYIQEIGAPIVVKAAGLAAGKGVVVAKSVEEAFNAVDMFLLDHAFGEAGEEIVIERFLEGEELSFFAVIDGENAYPLASAQDHKPAFDGDQGPNTGGMGAYSPAPICTPHMQNRIMETVVRPTMRGMMSEGNAFRGILYCGLMVDETGDFTVLEFNVRFGDPECQVLCARLKTDMLELLLRTATGRLRHDKFTIEWHNDPAVVVVMATNGYPGSYEKGSVISGVDRANALPDVTVYHAGTDRNENGDLVAAGGRVLGVTAKGATIVEAQQRAYEAVDAIDWPEGFCRRDIGWRAVEREEPVRVANEKS